MRFLALIGLVVLGLLSVHAQRESCSDASLQAKLVSSGLTHPKCSNQFVSVSAAVRGEYAFNQSSCTECGSQLKTFADIANTAECSFYSHATILAMGYDSKAKVYCSDAINNSFAQAVFAPTYGAAIGAALQGQVWGNLTELSASGCSGISYCQILQYQVLLEAGQNGTWASSFITALTKAVSACGVSSSDVSVCGLGQAQNSSNSASWCSTISFFTMSALTVAVVLKRYL